MIFFENSFSKLVVLLLLSILVGCTQNNNTPSAAFENSKAASKTFGLHLDTNDAAVTISRVKFIKPAESADSLYRNFISGLVKSNLFNAALQHLKAYESHFNQTPQQKSFSCFMSGEVFNSLAQYDSSIYYFAEALKVNLELKDSAAVAQCEHSIGYNLQFIGELSKSTEYLYRALVYYEQKNDSENIFLAYYDIAETYYQQKNFSKTLEYYKQCFEYYQSKSDTFQMAQMLSSLSDVRSKLSQNEEAIHDAVASLELWTRLGDLEGKANCLNTLAGIYVSQKKWNEAITVFHEAYNLVRQTEFQRPVPVLLLNLGVCYTRTGNYAEAEKYLLHSIEELTKIGLINQLLLAYKHTSTLYKKLGWSAKALEYYERFDSIQNLTAEKQSVKAIEELHVKYETVQHENEIMELNKKKHQSEHASRILRLLSIIVFLILALIITVLIYHYKNKQRKFESEKTIKELELAKAKLTHENDHKLMDGFAQRILEKNKLITDLEKKMKSSPTFSQSTESAKKSLEELSKLKILTVEDWDNFQMNYNKVFPGMIKHITTTFGDITEAELRMFLLIKLGISIRENSAVLGISPESVRKTRYRMRKKLRIGEQTDLDAFVKNFKPLNG